MLVVVVVVNNNNNNYHYYYYYYYLFSIFISILFFIVVKYIQHLLRLVCFNISECLDPQRKADTVSVFTDDSF